MAPKPSSSNLHQRTIQRTIIMWSLHQRTIKVIYHQGLQQGHQPYDHHGYNHHLVSIMAPKPWSSNHHHVYLQDQSPTGAPPHHPGLHIIQHIIMVIKGSPPSPSMHTSSRNNRDYHHPGCIVLWPLQGSHIIIIRYKASNICCWHQGQSTIWCWHQWQSTTTLF